MFTRTLTLSIALHALAASAAMAQGSVHHAIAGELTPATHRVTVRDEVTAPPGATIGREFLLSTALTITDATPPVERVPLGDAAPFFGNNGSSGALNAQQVARYRFKTAPSGTVRLAYEGVVDFGLSAQKEEYTRGFRDTPGQVGPEGVYLAGSTFWYPQFGNELVTFDLDLGVPADWHVVSQGEGTSRDARGRGRWRTDAAMDEIYVVGGPLRQYHDAAGEVETLVFLRQPDAALASKYLAATAQYLEMYRALIGPYPYRKFALVENFWETGYGMPSFTLLGSSVIRFPWILTSSYPHEILHNWWGNSVFVDYATGNWCEGLTAYLADHLLQEQRGKGDEYRRNTLQKYRNYVKESRDFPLTEFRARESAATEAVGYGKMLMGTHMLRRRMGDDKFRSFLAQFYREYLGKRASFTDLERTASAVAGEPLDAFFHDWVARPGAAELSVSVAPVRRDGPRFVVAGTLKQVQKDEPFALDVPVAVQTASGTTMAKVRLSGREQPFEVSVDAEPIALVVDPRFDVFRRLDPREIPASIGQIFGEPAVTAILPSGAPAPVLDAYRQLALSWQSDSHHVGVALDSEVKELPGDRAVWILGRENTWLERLTAITPQFRVAADRYTLDGERVESRDHTVVVTARHPANADKAIGFISVDPGAAFPGLSRKLPHYGKYSYLAFEGAEPVNTVKGEWVATDSPLQVDLRAGVAGEGRRPPLALPAEKPLAELPPAFSQKALQEHVAWLAAPERDGRGLGTRGLEQAAQYIADQFKAVGLMPGGDNGGWFQVFEVAPRGSEPATRTANVIGVLPGTKQDWQGQSVLVSAHYDHLGRGEQERGSANAGQVFAGADDNASGVAVLIELARALAAGERPERTIVFAAFSAEEAGLQGSAWYAAHAGRFPADKVIGVVNIDTVGRLGNGKVTILGAGSATEWPHIFRGASFVTGVESAAVSGNAEASDQRTFLERGIPAVQIFTGPHADYHRPGDTADKVDVNGLLKVATLVNEAVVYLAGRAEPLTVTISGASSAHVAKPPTAGAAAAAPGQAPARRVSFGTVPDFTYDGQGLKLTGVTPGSPAETAGFKAGDVITRVADRPIASLRDFSEVLKTLSPGQSVPVVFTRDGQEKTATVTVAER